MAQRTPVPSSTTNLLITYHQSPSVVLRNQLVRLHLGLVRKVAHRMARQCAEPYEDLMQCGCLGLIAAIERFDPTQGYAFSSFAVPYIRGEILHFLRDRAHAIKIPRRWQQLSHEAKKVRLQLTKDAGLPPTEQQVAQSLCVSLEEWRTVRMAMNSRKPVSINTPLSSSRNQSSEGLPTLADLLVDPQEQVRQQQVEDCLELQQALNQLEEQTRQLIHSVYFEQLSRQEVARRSGISAITVSRRIQKGIQQLGVLLQTPLLTVSGTNG